GDADVDDLLRTGFGQIDKGNLAGRRAAKLDRLRRRAGDLQDAGDRLRAADGEYVVLGGRRNEACVPERRAARYRCAGKRTQVTETHRAGTSEESAVVRPAAAKFDGA